MENIKKAETIIRKINFWEKRQHSPINEMRNQEVMADCRRLDYIEKGKNLIKEIMESGCDTFLGADSCGDISFDNNIILCDDCIKSVEILKTKLGESR